MKLYQMIYKLYFNNQFNFCIGNTSDRAKGLRLGRGEGKKFSVTSVKIAFRRLFYAWLFGVPRSENFFHLLESTFPDDNVVLLKLSIQYLCQKRMPPKAAAFWSSIKEEISKNL
jgi:hypothetical protein